MFQNITPTTFKKKKEKKRKVEPVYFCKSLSNTGAKVGINCDYDSLISKKHSSVFA